jgi:hypothetical protein
LNDDLTPYFVKFPLTYSDATALEAVPSGENGLLSADPGSTLFIETRTVQAQTVPA